MNKIEKFSLQEEYSLYKKKRDSVWGRTLLCYLITPYIATQIHYINEEDVGTKLTELVGSPRPYLIDKYYKYQTFDGALDYYWYWKSKSSWLRKYFDQDYYDTHAWLRWFTRCLWIWRNPAYGYKLDAGYYQHGVDVIFDDDADDRKWKKEQVCDLTRIFVNGKGEKGFLFRKRKRFLHFFVLETIEGYKYPFDPKWYDKAMIATRIKLSLYKKGK